MTVYENSNSTSGSPQVTKGELARWRHGFVDEELLWPVRPSILTGDDNPMAEHLLARVVDESVHAVQLARQAGSTVLSVNHEVQLGA